MDKFHKLFCVSSPQWILVPHSPVLCLNILLASISLSVCWYFWDIFHGHVAFTLRVWHLSFSEAYVNVSVYSLWPVSILGWSFQEKKDISKESWSFKTSQELHSQDFDQMLDLIKTCLFTTHSLISVPSQSNFSCTKTAVLWWYVQNFVLIGSGCCNNENFH